MLESITQTIADNPVALFMKGTPAPPMCGFSATVVDILQGLNVPFAGVDALTHPQFRYVLSGHSSWPTLPQLFVGGKLVGGCDIVRQLHDSGELKQLIAE